MPTQSTPAEVTAAATGEAATEKTYTRALKRATFDVKCAWDDLREAAKEESDDLRGDLLFSVRTRLESALAALKSFAAKEGA